MKDDFWSQSRIMSRLLLIAVVIVNRKREGKKQTEGITQILSSLRITRSM